MPLINLSNLVLTGSATNAGVVVGAVSGPTGMPVVLGGHDAAKFALTNGGIIPFNLTVSSADVAGQYAITLQPAVVTSSFTITVNTSPPSVGKFSIGLQVATKARANVRKTAAGTLLGVQPAGAVATVVGGPATATLASTTYTWWNLNFVTGADGWVADDNLIAAGVATPPPPPPPPSPPPPPPPPPPSTPPPTGTMAFGTLANRPQIGGGILSWIGPLGGGPSTGIYAPQSSTLTSSGPVVTTADGQVIEGLNIVADASLDAGLVTIRHNNTTVRQNNFLGKTADQVDRVFIFIAAGVTGTVIEDNLCDGNCRNGSGGTDFISGPGGVFKNATIRRNCFFRTENAISSPNDNVVIEENYFGEIGGSDADHIEGYPRGGSVQNLRIRYNTFDGTDNAQHGADSGINLTTGSGLPLGPIGPGIDISYNMFTNWPQIHPVNFDDTNNGAGGAGNLNIDSLVGNGFFNCQTPSAGLAGPNSSIKVNSANYIAATPTSTSGALINGTGKI